MSIATEITRIQQGKADIKAAIEAKGVTVPSNATIDTYDDYVSQISGGGSLPSNLADWTYDSNGNVTSIVFSAATVPSNAYKNNALLLSAEILSSTTSIGEYAFGFESNGGYGDTPTSSLSSVTFNEGLITIGNSAFASCGSLSALTIPSTVTTIGDSAFKTCSNVSRINSNTDGVWNIPSGITSIGSYAFDGYTNTPIDLYLPENSNAISFGSMCFNNSNIRTVTIPSSTPPNSDLIFTQGGYIQAIYVPCDGVHAYRVSNGFAYFANVITPITSETPCEVIDYKAKFYDASNNLLGTLALSTASTGTNITSAETSAYKSTAYRVEFGDCFVRLQNGAFKGFSHLTEIVLDGNCMYLANEAFNGCSSLSSITLKRNAVVGMGNTNCLTNTNNCTIYVPSSLVDSYKGYYNWKTYATRIQAIPS